MEMIPHQGMSLESLSRGVVGMFFLIMSTCVLFKKNTCFLFENACLFVNELSFFALKLRCVELWPVYLSIRGKSAAKIKIIIRALLNFGCVESKSADLPRKLPT